MAERATAQEQTSAQQGFSKPTYHPVSESRFTSPVTPKRTFEDYERPGKRPRLEVSASVPMTAAAALAEERQKSRSPVVANNTSPNPQAQALGALMGVSNHAISMAQTTPGKPPNPATTMSQPMVVVAEALHPASETTLQGSSTESQMQTSPVSLSSFGTLESIAVPSGMGTIVTSPSPTDGGKRHAHTGSAVSSVSPVDGNKAFSYPAPLLQPQVSDASKRGMSLPHSGLRQGTRSPSSKKHRCPYCATEFTRHHNLKSHLLTHSQEKPYLCSTCNSRFRRLHDLKRHTKLHTGERPHTCPKCNRKFARGDALARHNKGPGGCAGRRASMGSFAGDDDYEGGDDSMDGVVYGEPETMDDSEVDPKATPQIRRQAPSGDDTLDEAEHNYRMPSTYPPIQGRPPGGLASGSFPPRTTYGQTGPGPVVMSGAASGGGGGAPHPFPASGSTSNLRHSGPGSQIFAQNPMTESPKPISPRQPHRQSTSTVPAEATLNSSRSPNASQYQQTYPPPRGASGSSTLNVPPQLPPPHSLNPPDSRYTLASQGAPTHPPTQPSGPPTHMSGSGPLSSHSNSLSSHGHSGHSVEGATSMFAKEDRLWAYVKNLEQRVNSMQEEINSLRSQIGTGSSAQQ